MCVCVSFYLAPCEVCVRARECVSEQLEKKTTTAADSKKTPIEKGGLGARTAKIPPNLAGEEKQHKEGEEKEEKEEEGKEGKGKGRRGRSGCRTKHIGTKTK